MSYRDESSITKKVTPQTMPKGKKDVFCKSKGDVSSEIVVGEPTFLEVPRAISKITGKKRLNILNIKMTPNGCPFGVGLKTYILEGGKAKGQNILCLCTNDDFKWLQVESSAIEKMF